MKTEDLIEKCLLALREDEFPTLREVCRQWLSQPDSKPHVVVQIVGGCVDYVGADRPVKFTVIDHDTDSADPEKLVFVPDIGEDPVLVYEREFHISPEDVALAESL